MILPQRAILCGIKAVFVCGNEVPVRRCLSFETLESTIFCVAVFCNEVKLGTDAAHSTIDRAVIVSLTQIKDRKQFEWGTYACFLVLMPRMVTLAPCFFFGYFK